MRVPLYVRMLLWFLLNLAVLAALFALLIFLELRGQLSPLLQQLAGERLVPIAQVMHEELRRAPREDWPAVLENFGRSHQLEFLLVDPAGHAIAGGPRPLPEPVLREMRALGGPRPPPPRNFHPPNAPPREPFGELDQPPMQPPDRFPRDEPVPLEAGKWGRFVLRTNDPVLYWAGFRLPTRPPEPPRILLAVSRTLTGGGLFFNYWPWLFGGFGALLVSALLWLPFVRGITGRLREIMRASGRIAEGRFDIRLADGRRDELGELASEINRMAARLDGFLTGQKRFLGDIAHELCSPLARLQLALAILERNALPANAGAIAQAHDEAQEISALVHELLSFSKAALQRRRAPLVPVALRPLAENVVRREAGSGDEFHVEVAGDLHALADADWLQRALANVVRNASHHAGRSGPITIFGRRTGDTVCLSVLDQGSGVPEELLPKLFDPFFRADVSRTRETGGVGLGLAIVKTCVESCGGSVTCRNRQPTGFEVIVELRSADAHAIAG